ARGACRKTLVRTDVAAKLAIVRSRRDVISHQTRFEIEQGRLDPIAVASVGQQRDGKVEPLPEALGVLAVAVEEKAAVLDLKALRAQQPNINAHLALVAVLPCFIERDLAVLRGGLVIDNDQPAVTAHLPYIVDRAGDVEVRVLVKELHPDEGF